MNIPKKRSPKIVRYVNTIMALALYGFSIYHFTQPNAAWRSGTIEAVTATCLLASAYLLPLMAAFIVQIIFAIGLCGLGIRHEMHGHGYVSGTMELIFAVVLAYSAVLINRTKKALTQ